MEKTEEPNLSNMPSSKEPEGNWYGLCSDIFDWLENFKASLQKRCDNCRYIAPGIHCNPTLCEQKLTPKQILYGPKKPN